MEYKFSHLFSWSSGKPITPTEGDIPVYGSNGIIGYTTKAKYNNKIILGRVGAYCGSVEYCPSDFNATDNTLITTCDESKILYTFAYYLLKQYKLNGYAGGAAQPLITQGLLKHLKCDIPDIMEQKQISDVLSAYDDLIENNNKRIALLEKAAQELYKEWFVRFRFPGHENTKFVNGLPEGWKIKRLESVAKISAGGDRPSVYSENKTGECSVPIYSNGIGNFGLYGYTNQAKIFEESVTVSARGTVGFVCLREEPYVPIVRLLSITPRIEGLNVKYLYFVLKNDSIEGNGTSQQQVTVPMFSKRRIVIPEKNVTNRFAETICPIFKKRKQLFDTNQNLIKQRDLLLPRLMSGKLEVDVESINKGKETNKIISFEQFKQEFKFAARADNALSDDDVKNLYEAYCNDKCKKE